MNVMLIKNKNLIMSNSEKYSKIFVKIFSVSKSKLKKLKYQSIPQWDWWDICHD